MENPVASSPCLPINKDTFFSLFSAWSEERREATWYKLTTTPKNPEDLVRNYLPSKLWRLNNLYKIVDKFGERRTFVMNRSQFIVHAASQIHSRLLVLKSRQQGISTFELIDSFDDAIFRSTLNNGLMAQGTDEASTLLERTKFLWDEMPEPVKDFLKRKVLKDNSKEFTFNNKSTIFIRTSFRSATLQRLHISEYGKIANKYPDRARETKTGTLQTIAKGNRITIESTAEGHNDFKLMWDEAWKLFKSGGQFAPKDFYPVFLSWLEDPDCNEEMDQEVLPEHEEYFDYLEKELKIQLTRTQKNFWIMQYRELAGDIYQEYPATPEEAFRASKDGTYWSKPYMVKVIRNGQKRPHLYDPNLPVYVTVDAGMHDYFVFVFFQVFEKSIRIIGEFFHNNEVLGYYAKYLLEEIPKEWQIETVYLPHDFGVRELGAEESGMTRQDQFALLGVTNTEILPKYAKANGIELVRTEMSNIYIDESCEYLDKCFMGYSKKWDKKLLKWSDEDEKTEERHGADALRYMVEIVISTLRLDQFIGPQDANTADGIAL